MEKNGPDFGSHLQSVWPEAAVNANGLLLACGLLDIIVCMIIIKYGFVFEIGVGKPRNLP